MNTQDAWNQIISGLSVGPQEFPTVPKNKRNPVWFTASCHSNVVYIDKATKNKPASNLTGKRILNYKIFEKIYPLYLRREKGEPVSHEATSVTVDQVYYYSLIHHLCI
jgi:hypothetical protein